MLSTHYHLPPHLAILRILPTEGEEEGKGKEEGVQIDVARKSFYR